MTRSERGQQIWQVLVSAAHNRQILTYKLLAELIGMGPGTLATPLGTVMFYCKQRRLPPLTMLVVNSKMGKPGRGLPQPGDQNRERERVFGYYWFKALPPSAPELEQAYKRGWRPRA
jgi:hypothetical protein